MRALLSLIILGTLAFCQDFTEEVHISQGRLRGKRVHQNFRGAELVGDEYLGIPFASPPVGDLRWAPPQPPKAWEGLRDAVNYAAGCPQHCLLPHIDGSCPKNQSEDCLYLNIWTPLSAAQRVRDGLAAPFPVMFWIHGGGFTEGSASCTAYYGLFLQNLTNQVIVTVNYRLAALGFLMTPSVVGNFGIQDQRLAMQWVKANIAQFGGNPDSVTIFGESAGGMSVSTHLVSPLSAGLFHKALMESNPVSEYHTNDEGMNIGKDFCSAVGCDWTNLTCLRALSTDTILSAGGSWEVTIDGSTGNLPDVPLTLFKQGSYNKVPTVLGTNKEEAAIFLSYGFERPMSATEYENVIRIEYPKTYKEVLQLYPPVQDGDNRITYSYLLTHQNWACPGAQIILSISKYNPAGMPAFVYYFEHICSVPIWHEPICQEAVCHAEELPFVWNTTSFVTHDIENPTPDEVVLAERMMTYWGQFSATGNPTISTQVPWPAFVSTSNISMVLDTPNVYTDPGHLQVYCNFWDAQ